MLIAGIGISIISILGFVLQFGVCSPMTYGLVLSTFLDAGLVFLIVYLLAPHLTILPMSSLPLWYLGMGLRRSPSFLTSRWTQIRPATNACANQRHFTAGKRTRPASWRTFEAFASSGR